jgi:hypothetical protein
MGLRGRVTSAVVSRIAIVAAMVALIAISASTASATRVVITKAPNDVFAHQRVLFSAVVSPTKDKCRLTIRDTAGGLQTTPAKLARRGRVAWLVNVRAIPGPATVTVSCARAGSASVTINVRPPKQVPITIDNKGFSQSGDFRWVSYGVAFRNDLGNRDLTAVQLLVNFLDKDNVPVYPSPHPTLALLPAHSTFYLGGRVRLETVRPVVRMDARAIAATPEPRIMTTPPLISNQAIVCGGITCGPQPPRPVYPNPSVLTGVAGQVLLNRSPRMMQSAVMGDVLLDSSGKIIGGGFGTAEALAFGTFESFFVRSSVEVPWADGMTTLVSAVPRYLPRTLVASTLRVVPLSPRAGSSFTVSLDVIDTSLNQTVQATGAQCILPGARVRSYVSRGRATCRITTPTSARGQTLTGFITAQVGTSSAMSSFSVRLR